MNELQMRLAMKLVSVKPPWQLRLNEVTQTLRSLNITSVLVVTDEVIGWHGLCKELMRKLSDSGISYAVYDKVTPNPTVENVEEAFALYQAKFCGGIIAVGGGSPIDCAKAVGARASNPKKTLPQMRGSFKALKRIPTTIAIPTTAGSGSEATATCEITDSENNETYVVTDFAALVPQYVVLDPLFTKNLSPELTAMTGMDTLARAVEVYIGKNNNKQTSNDALDAIKLVFGYLPAAYQNGTDMTARQYMQQAAFKAGTACARCFAGNAHAIAHTLSALYGTPHALANAVVLPYVLDAYGSLIYKRLAELAYVADITSGSDQEKAVNFIEKIRELNKSMNIPGHVIGLQEADMPVLAERALREANPIYPVPRAFTTGDMLNIYRDIYKPSSNFALPGVSEITASAERLATEQAEAERVAAEKAEIDRKAAEEAARRAAEAAEAEAARIAAEEEAAEEARKAEEEAARRAEEAAIEATQFAAEEEAAEAARIAAEEEAAAEAARIAAELEAAAEAARIAELEAAAEAARIAELEAAAEAARIAELEAAAEAARIAAEEEAAAEAARIAELEAAAEAARIAAEEEAAAEAARIAAEEEAAAEAARIAAELEAAAEAARIAAELEAAAEAARIAAELEAAAEAARIAAEEEAAAEAARIAELEAAAEAARIAAELEAAAEAARIAEEEAAAEAARIAAEEEAAAEAARIAEEAAAAEAARIAEEEAAAEAARIAAEEEAAAEAARIAAEEEAAAEAARIAEEEAAAEAARIAAEEEAAAEEARRAAEEAARIAAEKAAAERIAAQKAEAERILAEKLAAEKLAAEKAAAQRAPKVNRLSSLSVSVSVPKANVPSTAPPAPPPKPAPPPPPASNSGESDSLPGVALGDKDGKRFSLTPIKPEGEAAQIPNSGPKWHDDFLKK